MRTPTKGFKGPVLDSEASVAQVNSARQATSATLATSPIVTSFRGNKRTLSGLSTLGKAHYSQCCGTAL